jgi:hypothetical protein
MHADCIVATVQLEAHCKELTNFLIIRIVLK